MPKSKKLKKVLLNRKVLKQRLRTFKRFEDVEFPELTGKLGFPEDVIPILKIKAASLDDHIRCRTIAERAAIMGIKLAEMVTESKNVLQLFDVNWIQDELRKPETDKAMMEISLFHRCVMKPKISMRDAYVISKTLPEVVNRVATKALSMSSLENVK
jgi:hypothetical protein